MKKAAVTTEYDTIEQIPRFKIGTQNENFGAASKAFMRILKGQFGCLIDDVILDQDYQPLPIDPIPVRRIAKIADFSPTDRAEIAQRLSSENIPAQSSRNESEDVTERRKEIIGEFLDKRQTEFDDIREDLQQRRKLQMTSDEKRLQKYNDDKARLCAIMMQKIDEEMRVRILADETGGAYDERQNNPRVLWKLISKFAMNDDATTLNPIRFMSDAFNQFIAFRQEKNVPLASFYEEFQIAAQRYEAAGGSFVPGNIDMLVPEHDAQGVQRTLAERKNLARQEILANHFCDKVNDSYDSIITNWRLRASDGVNEFPKTVEQAYSRLREQRELLQKPSRVASGRGVAFATTHHGETTTTGSEGLQNKGASSPKTAAKKFGSKGACHFCRKPGHFQKDCRFLKAQLEEFLKTPAGEAALLEKRNCNHEDSNSDNNTYFVSLAETDVKGLISDNDILLDNQSTVNVFKNKSLLKNIRSINQGVQIAGVGGSIFTNTIGDHHVFGTVFYHPQSVANILSFADMKEIYKIRFDADKNEFRVKISPTKNIKFRCIGKLYKYAEHLKGELACVQTVDDNMRQFSKREVGQAQLAREFYIRMGRPSEKDFRRIVSERIVEDCPVSVTDVDNAQIIFGKDLGAIKGRTIRGKLNNVEIPFISARDPLYKNLSMCVDLMEINGVQMLVSVTRKLKLLMARFLPSKTKEDVFNATKEMIDEYSRHGFEITAILSDGASEFISAGVSMATHRVRWNTVAKNQHVPEIERNIRLIKERCRSIINTLPFQVPQSIIEHMVHHAVTMINMVPREGERISPRQAVVGKAPNAKEDFAIVFGAYAQVPEENEETKNSMNSRTVGAICVGHAGKLQKAYNFISLKTWRILTRSQWTELPMPSEVILILNERAQKERTAKKKSTHIDPNAEILPTENDGPVVEAQTHDTNARGDNDTNSQYTSVIPDSDMNHGENHRGEPQHFNRTDSRDSLLNLVNAVSRRSPELAATNLSVPKALKECGSEALMSLFNESGQMVTKEVFHPVQWESLSWKQKRQVLRSLMFLKRKRDGRLKSRFCVDGRPQKIFGVNMDPSSPTAGTQSIFISALIDATEGRVVKVVDIEGAYLKVNMTEDVYVQVDDTVSAILVNMMPQWHDYLRGDGKLIVKLDKALYGCVQAARLFYDHVASTLRKLGFKENAYDKCVFNKVHNGKQCTVVVYVDDLKISCAHGWVVDKVISDLKKAYQTLTVKEGNKFDYLGMELDYSAFGEVSVSMESSERDAINDYSEEIGEKTSATPASNDLYDRRKGVKLSASEADRFHSVVAKLLYIAKRARPDILTAVSFLTTRVQAPDVEDRKKLLRILRYLNGTISKAMRLVSTDLTTIHAYIDASFAVYSDFIGVTGAVLKVGEATVYTQSSKQKLVAKSSTEAEIVGVSEALGQALWLRYFMMEQGYNMNPVVLHQDNKSAIWMENAGYRMSKRTRHMNIKYFHVADRIKLGEVTVRYLKTEDMIADVMTKPLQGSKFRDFQEKIMNGKSMTSRSMQGCVEKGNIGKICEEKKDIDQENIGGGLLLPMSETGDPDDPDDLEQAEFEESFP